MPIHPLIKNVIFDFGGVLVRWKPEEIIDGFYEDVHLRKRLRETVFGHPDWLEMDRGTLDEELAAQRFAERMGRPIAEMMALLDHVRSSLTPIEESVALVRDLHRRGIPLYGLSNISESMFAYLRERDDHWRVFKGIVISGKVRMVKPEARIFEHICSTYALVPRETVFIDDLKPNVEAAGRLGFHTILFTVPGPCASELGRLLEPGDTSP